MTDALLTYSQRTFHSVSISFIIGIVSSVASFLFVLFYSFKRGINNWRDLQNLVVIVALIMALPFGIYQLESRAVVRTQASQEATVISKNIIANSTHWKITINLSQNANTYLRLTDLQTGKTEAIYPQEDISQTPHTFLIRKIAGRSFVAKIIVNGKEKAEDVIRLP